MDDATLYTTHTTQEVRKCQSKYTQGGVEVVAASFDKGIWPEWTGGQGQMIGTADLDHWTSSSDRDRYGKLYSMGQQIATIVQDRDKYSYRYRYGKLYSMRQQIATIGQDRDKYSYRHYCGQCHLIYFHHAYVPNGSLSPLTIEPFTNSRQSLTVVLL